MGKTTFVVGLGIGYVLGARAGRERYESIRRTARQVKDSPAVQEAAGVVGAQASEIAGTAKQKVGDRLTDGVQQGIHAATVKLRGGGSSSRTGPIIGSATTNGDARR